MHLSRREVIEYIRNFLDDLGGDWDWDDFISIRLDTPDLEAIRVECATLPERYPPERSGRYCNEEGLQVLRTIVLRLETQELRERPLRVDRGG